MKRNIVIVTFLAAFALVACEKKAETTTEKPAAADQAKPASADNEAPEPAATAETPKPATVETPKPAAAETPKPAEAPKPAAAAVAAAAAATPPPAKPGDLPAPPDVAAPPADAEKTASGLAHKLLSAGTGDKHPGPTDRVTVNYTGWTTDGRMFDSSVKRGTPATFPLNGVIPGWTEGLQLMTVGEKRRFWIPGKLAYGDTPRRPGAPAGTLVFDVELLGIKETPKIETPADVAAPPADAKKTESGLAYEVLTPGKGTQHPTAADTVEVHYSGWTTDGKMFDSSVMRGQPAIFPLGGVIKGWTEGLQLMVPGEKTRFWIPADLAYGDPPKRPGAPAGMLVFDVELISIK